MIKIVRLKILVIFETYGCSNMASILMDQYKENEALNKLATSRRPLKEMALIARQRKYKNGIEVDYHSSGIVFWPLYQPA